MNTKLFSLFLFILCLGLSSCKGDKTQNPKKDTVLDIGLSKDPRMLNPIINSTPRARLVNRNIFIPMADFHPETYKLSPILIKEVPEAEQILEGPYKGGTKYTFEFKEEAKWDNGSPITAKDLLFTIKAVKHPKTDCPLYKGLLQWVSDIELDPTNDRKITYIFKDYYILAKELSVTLEVYPQYVYDPKFAMDEITIAELNSDKATELVESNPLLMEFAESFNSVKFSRETISGAGPYKVKDWISDQLIVLEKKKNYWANGLDIPYLANNPDMIKFHIIADQTSVINQMKEGNIDVFQNVNANTFLDLKQNETYGKEFQFYTPELMKTYYISINNSKPKFSDPDVRRALAKLMDVPKLVEILEKGLGQQAIGPINHRKAYFNKNIEGLSVDIDGAKQILEAEGWKDTNADGTIDKNIKGQKVEMEIDFYISGSNLSKNIALLFQDNAKKVGITTNIIAKPNSEINENHIKTGDYDFYPVVLSQDLALDDPYLKWHSGYDTPNPSNIAYYRSEKANKLIDKIRSTQSAEERNGYYKDLQEVLYEDQPVIFLYNPTEKIIVSNRWKGSSTLKRPGYFAGTFTAN